MRILRCPAYFHVRESKFDLRAKKAILLGYVGGVNDYKLWSPKLHKVITSKDVTIDEFVMSKLLCK